MASLGLDILPRRAPIAAFLWKKQMKFINTFQDYKPIFAIGFER